MSKNKSIVSSVFSKSCPRCRKGKLFIEPLDIKNPNAMPEHCDICGQKFEPEPGFYYGAMFISYILSGFFFLACAGIGIILFDLSVNLTFVFILLIAAATYLWFLRISRSIWIHIMVKYDPEAEKNFKIRNF